MSKSIWKVSSECLSCTCSWSMRYIVRFTKACFFCCRHGSRKQRINQVTSSTSSIWRQLYERADHWARRSGTGANDLFTWTARETLHHESLVQSKKNRKCSFSGFLGLQRGGGCLLLLAYWVDRNSFFNGVQVSNFWGKSHRSQMFIGERGHSVRTHFHWRNCFFCY